MGDAIVAWFQGVFGHAERPKAPAKVGPYPVDYSGLSDADFAAAAPCDQVVQSTEWIPVNRRA